MPIGVRPLTIKSQRGLLIRGATLEIGATSIINQGERLTGPLRLGIWAVAERSLDRVKRGHLIASHEVDCIPAGATLSGLHFSADYTPPPSGYYRVLMTLDARAAPREGWTNADHIELDAHVFLGPPVIVDHAAPPRASADTLTLSPRVQNLTDEPTRALRLSCWATHEPYHGGALKGFPVGKRRVEPLAPNAVEDLAPWELSLAGLPARAVVLVLILEEAEAAGEAWLTRHYAVLDRAAVAVSAAPQRFHDDYVALGCLASDSDEVIRRRFKQLVFQHHPDRAGADAGERLLVINEAYRRIKIARGR